MMRILVVVTSTVGTYSDLEGLRMTKGDYAGPVFPSKSLNLNFLIFPDYKQIPTILRLEGSRLQF